MIKKVYQFIKLLGPGLMWAGAAVGVSHLVQSTRAGAEYGFALVGVLILANIVKYPFFEFAPRYTASTGKHLVDAYNDIGKWAVILYGLFTVLTMFSIQAAVTIVTSGILSYVFGLKISVFSISVILMLSLSVLIALGRYQTISKVMKIVILILTVSTIVAVISAFNVGFGNAFDADISGIDWANPVNLAFVIAFVGWMPAPIDISVWHSFWSFSKNKETGEQTNLKNALLDFNVGYIGTAILAIGFLTLGATFMYGSGESFSSKGVVFSGQLISLYTTSIGDWAYYIIAIAALATMFSTTLTCLDAYSKILVPTTRHIFSCEKKGSKTLFYIWLSVVVIGSLSIIGYFSSTMTYLVDFATTISFVTAPIVAFLNLKSVLSKSMPEEHKPSKFLKIYAYIGLGFLLIFSIGFVYWRFIW